MGVSHLTMDVRISLLLTFVVSLGTLSRVDGLECYVCTEQEDNEGKCITSIKTCEQSEDHCLTETKWGSTPYWSQGAIKQYYISKRCSTKEGCERHRRLNMPYCTHIWYEDWSCSECCQGDRCNYFIISGDLRTTFSTILWILSSSVVLVVNIIVFK